MSDYGKLVSFKTLNKIVEDECVGKSECNPLVRYADIWKGTDAQL